jgi:hypothetical protein
LHVTNADWTGASSLDKVDTCMVISRPCAAAHKAAMVVVPVRPLNVELQMLKDDFNKVLQFLEKKLRDASDMPDRFYLGELPDTNQGFFAAYLDSLHTIQLPESETLKTFLQEMRIARLSDSFLRDLHYRIFRSVAQLGFEDHGWFCDRDLELLVSAGDAMLAGLTQKASQAKQDYLATKNDQAATKPKLDGLEKAAKNAEMEVNKFKEKLSPYKQEWNQRQGRPPR